MAGVVFFVKLGISHDSYRDPTSLEMGWGQSYAASWVIMTNFEDLIRLILVLNIKSAYFAMVFAVLTSSGISMVFWTKYGSISI